MIDSFEKEARRYTNKYQPNDKARDSVKNYGIVTVSGPSHCGSHAVMLASGTPVVGGWKTGPLDEAGAKLYRPIEYTEQQEAVIAHLKEGNFVYAATHPRTGAFFGALADDFHEGKGRRLLRIFPGQNKKLRESGLFGELLRACIIPSDYDKWNDSLPGRTQPDSLEYLETILDAKATLEEVVPDSGMHFIMNSDIEAASTDLPDIR